MGVAKVAQTKVVLIATRPQGRSHSTKRHFYGHTYVLPTACCERYNVVNEACLVHKAEKSRLIRE